MFTLQFGANFYVGALFAFGTLFTFSKRIADDPPRVANRYTSVNFFIVRVADDDLTVVKIAVTIIANLIKIISYR